MQIDDRIVTDLRARCDKLLASGDLLPKTKLAECYQTFREHFGREVLLGLDGEVLLETMHNHGNRDSLVYWLEFKDDDELPGTTFGSIAGGSALKFGIYKRRETGEWTVGSSRDQHSISVEEAITIARRHRDQLARGIELLTALPADANEAMYRQLQKDMDDQAPDVSRLAWGHKYFTMLSPEKLDDYHSPTLQRYHLIKLLQIPPEGDGRYTPAYWFTQLAGLLDIPMNWTTSILNQRQDPPYRYWRIGTSDGTTPRNRWEMMRDGDCVAIGWAKLGDLSGLEYKQESKVQLKSLMAEKCPSDPRAVGKAAAQVFRFVTTIAEGDIVAAADGETVIGIGKVTGGYSFDPSYDFPHRRPVTWLTIGDWKMPQREGLQTTVHELSKYPENLVEIEGHILDAGPVVHPPKRPSKSKTALPQLEGLPGRIQTVLEHKGQVILYGPPGTGKTFWAERTACDLAAYDLFGNPFEELDDEQRQQILAVDAEHPGNVRTCCFHPAYGYEDFLEGYRPCATEHGLGFDRRDGIFKRLCEDAHAKPQQRFYLIIDEINRGDIPRIFGELLMVLEKDKRGKPIVLPLSAAVFRVPQNIFIIGTMNTADRSIALLDTALRRRFGFIELMPDMSLLEGAVVAGIPLGPWLDALNQRICRHVGRDARNLQVGHSYLLYEGRPIADFARLARVVREEIVPLLQEYCYEDYAALEQILGSSLVDGERQQIRHQLFDGAKRDDLVRALLQPSPELATSTQAVASDQDEAEQVDEQDDQDNDQGTEDETEPT